MTDKEKLQRLFDAALKDTSEVTTAPTRAFPTPVFQAPPAPRPLPELVQERPVGVVEKVQEETPLAPHS